MTSNNIEKKLSRLTLQAPDNNLKDKVLSKARTAWEEKPRVFIFPSKLIRNYAYALAILLLISITSSKIDIFLTDKLLAGDTSLIVKTVEKPNDIMALCYELGINCKNYKVFANMFREEKKECNTTIFNLREKLMNEFNLINGGLS